MPANLVFARENHVSSRANPFAAPRNPVAAPENPLFAPHNHVFSTADFAKPPERLRKTPPRALFLPAIFASRHIVPADPLPCKSFETAAAWKRWLAKNHAASTGVWLQFAKKGSGARSVTYAEALELALCYGWIDGQAKRLNDTHYLQRFSPRRRDSIWSQRNRAKALALIESGLMQPTGLAAIEQAKANGRWDSAYAGASKAEVPPGLAAALSDRPKAAAFFAQLNSRNRYAILFRLQTAKRAETRTARLRDFVAMLERGETLHP